MESKNPFKKEHIDIGNRTFEQSFIDFTNTLELAITISKMGSDRIAEKDHIAWACILFTRLCVIGKSLKKLLDINIQSYDEHWDFASSFSLTRNIMECHQTLYYLCFDNVSEEELKARKYLFNVHDYYSRKIMISHLEPTEDLEIEKIVIQQLKENIFFKNLSSVLSQKEMNAYLSGKKSFFISREEIEQRQGTDINNFRFWYKFLSTNIHTYPVGFYRMLISDRGTGVHSTIEESYSAFALDISEKYLLRGIRGFLNIFPDIKQTLENNEWILK